MTQQGDPTNPSNVPPPAGDPTVPPTPPPPTAQPVDYQTPGTAASAYVGPAPDQNARTMGMLCHLLSLTGYVIPLGNILGPLIIWQVKKAEHPFIDDQGKESMNFQITVLIALIIAAATICIGIGFFLLPAVGIAAIVLAIIAGIKANAGEAYRYPLTLRLIK